MMDSMKMNSRMENDYMGNPMNTHSFPMPDFSNFSFFFFFFFFFFLKKKYNRK